MANLFGESGAVRVCAITGEVIGVDHGATLPDNSGRRHNMYGGRHGDDSATHNPLCVDACATSSLPSAPYQPHSETSKRAAERVVGKASLDREKIMGLIRAAGERGMTDKELQAALEMDGSSQRPRRIELMRRGLVVAKGERDGCACWRVV